MEQLQHPAANSSGIAKTTIDRLKWGCLIAALTERHAAALAVGWVLAKMANNGYCWPGQKHIAKDSGYSRRSVQEGLDTLVKCGLVIKQKRFHDSCGYWLVFPKVKVQNSTQ